MLDINPILVLTVFVTFLTLLYILNLTLFKPLVKHIDDRTFQIKKDLENAKSNSSNVNDILEEANHIVAAAKKEAALIQEEVSLKAKQTANSKLKIAQNDIDLEYEAFTKKLAKERVVLRESLLLEIPVFKERLKNKINLI